jgi:integrase
MASWNTEATTHARDASIMRTHALPLWATWQIESEAFRRQLVPAVVDRYRALVAVAGGTGLRWGEAIGPCDDAVDLDRGHLQVIRTVIEVSGYTSFKPYPKSTAGRRTIPLPSWLVSILRDHMTTFEPGEGEKFQAAWSTEDGRPHRELFATRLPRSRRSPGSRQAAPVPRPPPLLRHLARRRRRPAEHGPADHGTRAVLDNAGPLHAENRQQRPHPPGPQRRPRTGRRHRRGSRSALSECSGIAPDSP